MSKIFFTPGPSQPHPRLREFMDDAFEHHVMSLSHRSLAYQEIHKHTVTALRELMSIPSDYQIFFVGSATEAMERIVQNMAIKYTQHFVSGAFGKKCYTIAKQSGKTAKLQEGPEGSGFEIDDTTIEPETELVCLVHNETSTGVMVQPETIQSIRKRTPNVLVAVDVVSSAPLSQLDASKIDALFFSVQKGFGLPAGLGVLAVSPRAMEKSRAIKEAGMAHGSFHSFSELSKNARSHQTPETPNVLGIYLLGRVLDDMSRIGMHQLLLTMNHKYDLLNQAVQKHSFLHHFVSRPEHRSKTVLVIKVEPDAATVRNQLAAEGIIVGEGYGQYRNRHLRIANFPAIGIDAAEKLAAALASLT